MLVVIVLFFMGSSVKTFDAIMYMHFIVLYLCNKAQEYYTYVTLTYC